MVFSGIPYKHYKSRLQVLGEFSLFIFKFHLEYQDENVKKQ